MRLKTAIGDFLRARGYHVFREEHLPQANLGLHLQHLFTAQRIDCVFDIGANRGQYYDFLRTAVNYQGLVISVEPQLRLFRELEAASRRDPLWQVQHCAFGAEDTIATFNIMKSDALSSFRQPSAAGTDRFHESNQVVGTESVAVHRLEDVYARLAKEHRFSRPYLKIDTQGFDLEVAAGAGASLGSFIALQTEANVLPIYEGAPTLNQTIEYFTTRGYVLSSLSPVAVDQQFRLIDCDCVFVNPALAVAAPVLKY